ncbi:hypothetical protein ACIQUM_07685 [Amycolatopsis azurea]|uniref:hypothetical protein n=1 Tax=Amycolatopsis azurea TaxID=36819 RepID=UPI003815318E
MAVSPAKTDDTDGACGPNTTFDLMICHDDRILFRGHYDSPEGRLRVCVGILTGTHLVSDLLGPGGEAAIRDLYDASTTAGSSSDASLRDINDVCGRSGVRIYVGTTTTASAVPAVFYSVVTEYLPDHVTAEHFPNGKARHASLLERVSQLHAGAGDLPESVLSDEERLAGLLGALLTPARISLTESVLDATDGVYKPVLGAHDVDQRDR